jgi:hypothetical protein
MKEHVLKTHPEYFKAIVDGTKTFECKKNDRDFKVGDILELKEYDPKNDYYSGKIEYVRVTYIPLLWSSTWICSDGNKASRLVTIEELNKLL